jgi:hypothetical protein
MHYGIELRFYALMQESLIQRARNYCCDEFLRSVSIIRGEDGQPLLNEDGTEKTEPYTHMIFLDSDIGFNAQDVIIMMGLMQQHPEYDILTAPYPKKCISWEKVKQAADRGLGDDNPSNLEKFIGDFVFNPISTTGVIPLDRPVEILDGGTGFMMIRRETFLKFKEAYPEKSYKPDHARTEHFDGSREILAYFDCVIEPETKRYLSEDYYFTQMCRKAGMKTLLCPWMQTTHTGSFIFGGSLADLAAAGAAATVDSALLKKTA